MSSYGTNISSSDCRCTVVPLSLDQEHIDDDDDALEEEKNSKTDNLYQCSICMKLYSTLDTFEAHLDLHDSADLQTFPACSTCGLTCKTELERKKHELTHFHSEEEVADVEESESRIFLIRGAVRDDRYMIHHAWTWFLLKV